MASEPSQFEVSEPETQFVPKSDDEETLWTVLEILQEKGKRYKVKWAGIDPETKKSWAPSWVHKHDCTPDLVAEWKRKKLSKKARRNSAKSFRGGSTISRVSKSDTLSKASNASSSTTVPHKSRQSIVHNETDYDSPPTAGPSKPRQTLTKKTQPLPEPESGSEDSDTNLIQRSSHTPKKRKRVSSDSEDLPDVATLVRSSSKKRKLNEPPRRNGKARNSDSARASVGPSRKSKSIPKDLAGNGTESGRGRAASAVSNGGRISPPNSEDGADGSAGPSKLSDRGSVGSNKPAASRGRLLTTLNGSRKPSSKSPSRSPYQSPPAEESADAPNAEPPSSPPVTFPTKRPDPIYRNLSPSTSLRLKEWEDELALIEKQKEEAAAVAAIASPPSPIRDEMPPPSSPTHDQHSQLSPGNDSYRKGVVPATDTESSNNTQSQSQQIASQESHQPLPRTTSLVKSMKGKSPTKGNLNEKPKGPIPQMSPSAFTPYLRPQPVGEDGELPSSIEQFSSPVRPSGEEIVTRASISEDSRDGQLRDRGAQLAEEARSKMKGPTIKKLSLLDIQRQYREREREKPKPKLKGRVQEQEKAQAIEYPNSNENTRTDADDEADGGDGARPNDEDAKVLLRREEEESSQDILDELARAQAGPKPIDEPAIIPQTVDDPMQIDEVTDLMYPAESYVDDGPPHITTGVEHHDEDLAVPISKPAEDDTPVPPTSPLPVPEPRNSQLSPEDESEGDDLRSQLARALKVLNAKSEEIVNLDRLLVAEREKNELLQKQTAVQVPDEQPERDQATIRLLTVSLEDANKAKLAAEKDRDFVREQYMNASGYVTTVRSENTELEKRAQIAEKQATEGVALVRATFTERIRFLEEDVKSWRQMADFAVAKDSRMNDDIRRRAAEAPELQYRNEKLKEEIEELNTHIGELNSELAKKDEEISELHIRLEMDIPELVYPCHWRPVGGEGPCDALLDSKEELEKHVLTAPGHL
ncbi:uncharacterized protein ARMOST_12335 [Armillaria ostoyae]|uniref:Chromo domain-containing protein n=1 Tax=Armillaria ostoyae TaxID=47428 RepID=A0A284RJL3_ARMOS|nr:uncharacterized protein ARMOST_12335 [Armillaria ostoyae]